jgi:hypothetical protein
MHDLLGKIFNPRYSLRPKTHYSFFFLNTSKVPVLRYEIKNLEVEHKFLKIHFLITILDYR